MFDFDISSFEKLEQLRREQKKRLPNGGLEYLYLEIPEEQEPLEPETKEESVLIINL